MDLERVNLWNRQQCLRKMILFTASFFSAFSSSPSSASSPLSDGGKSQRSSSAFRHSSLWETASTTLVMPA